MPLHRSLLLVPVVAALLAAGCGSSKNNDKVSATTPATTTTSTSTAPAAAGGAASKVTLSADPSKIAFNTKTLSAKAGTVTIAMTNPSSISHAIGVSGNGVDKDGKTVMAGGTSSVTLALKPGKYSFYCPVDGHKKQGMAGTLTVK